MSPSGVSTVGGQDHMLLTVFARTKMAGNVAPWAAYLKPTLRNIGVHVPTIRECALHD